MKYFSLSETLTAVPLSFLLGTVLSLIGTLSLSVLYGMKGFFALVLKNIKTKTNITAEVQTARMPEIVHFIISEMLACILSVAFGIIFTVYVYIVSDGIVRIYIPILTLLGYWTFSHLFKRPLEKVFYFISLCVYKILCAVLYASSYIPLVIIKKIIKRKTGNKIQK